MIKITLTSFGFKYGTPNSNYWFDVGFAKNPAREFGFFCNDKNKIYAFMEKQEQVMEFIKIVEPLIVFLSKVDQNQVISFGCSAGRHRSPFIVDYLANLLKEKYKIEVKVFHRNKEI